MHLPRRERGQCLLHVGRRASCGLHACGEGPHSPRSPSTSVPAAPRTAACSREQVVASPPERGSPSFARWDAFAHDRGASANLAPHAHVSARTGDASATARGNRHDRRRPRHARGSPRTRSRRLPQPRVPHVNRSALVPLEEINSRRWRSPRPFTSGRSLPIRTAEGNVPEISLGAAVQDLRRSGFTDLALAQSRVSIAPPSAARIASAIAASSSSWTWRSRPSSTTYSRGIAAQGRLLNQNGVAVAEHARPVH